MTFIGHIRQLVRFMQLPRSRKRIVFYSEGKAYRVHLEELILDLLRSSDIPVCYITSGENDPGLQFEHENYTAFLTDEGWVRNWLFENIDTDVMVMTMPDLDQYQIRRSHHQVHYVYVQHSLVSLHMAYRKGAFDHFDTVLCSGHYHCREIRAMEDKYGLPPKMLVEHAYSRLFKIMEENDRHTRVTKDRTAPGHVLVAPSWGQHGLIETVGREIVELLLDGGFRVTLRPHPQTVKFAKDKLDAILKQFSANPLFTLEVDVASQDSLHQSDAMISDWSGAALEYAFGLKKPVLFVDVPRKVNNRDYGELQLVPFEERVRDKIGRILAVQDLHRINATLTEMINSSQVLTEIENVRSANLFDTTVNDRPVSHILKIVQGKSTD